MIIISPKSSLSFAPLASRNERTEVRRHKLKNLVAHKFQLVLFLLYGSRTQRVCWGGEGGPVEKTKVVLIVITEVMFIQYWTMSTHSQDYSGAAMTISSAAAAPVNANSGNSKRSCSTLPSEVLAPGKRANSEKEDMHNPFGLKDKATKWLQDEMAVFQDSYLVPPNKYRPHISKDGRVAPAQIKRAFAESINREAKPYRLRPVLIVVGLEGYPEDFLADESLHRARYLFSPDIDIGTPIRVLKCSSASALFVTYMPGPEHGVADASFMDHFGAWKTSNQILKKYLSSGVSSGSEDSSQPDRRVFPIGAYRDFGNPDRDRSNKNNAYSRLIWEVEFSNRDPVKLRVHGRKLMRPRNVRLFLGAKFSEFDENGHFEAAIVLWGKPDGHNAGGDIAVVTAVSFGTKCLSDETKTEFSRRGGLPPVAVDAWRRPQDAATAPLLDPPATTPAPWLLNISVQGILYRVTASERDDDGNPQYLLDMLGQDLVADFPVNLLDMAREYWHQGQNLYDVHAEYR